MTMNSAMGKKISRDRRTPASSLSDGVLKSTGFSVVVADQPVLLNDQANVMFTGLREPMFQQQTVTAGFHSSPFVWQLRQSLDLIGGAGCLTPKTLIRQKQATYQTLRACFSSR